MKTILSLRRHHYLKTVGILLIAVALIVGTISCDGVTEYDLTMAEAPAGTGTATDETGGSPYAKDKVVDIKAVPADCYRFVDWSTTAGAIGNTTAAETTFTMPAEDVTVTANFELTPPDHFKFYEVYWETEPPVIGMDVQLVDQFGTFEATVGKAVSFGNPVEKVHADMLTPIADLTRHYTLYELVYDEEPQGWKVMINNQFQDDVELTVFGPYYLAVPTQKEDHGMPVCLNHYLVYEVGEADYGEFTPVEGVNLKDQFIEEDVTVWGPVLFANPVEKTVGSEVTEIEDPDEHLVFYSIEDIGFDESIDKTIQIDNQFGEQTLYLTYRETLAVPTQKISWEQPLNHFKTYWADWPIDPPAEWVPPLPVNVQLEDQFVTINATVLAPYLFANPTVKGVGEEWTPIWDPKDHLTLYSIEYCGEPHEWDVTVNNQFGPDQVLRVAGPFWLAVPTGKLTPDWPADLNHFLVYEVYWQEYPTKDVYIQDQFINGWTNMDQPGLFAVPAQKTHESVTTPIVGDDHLVFYWIDGIYYWDADNLPVVNQFGEQYLYVQEGEGNFLGVPSQKISWEGPYPYMPP